MHGYFILKVTVFEKVATGGFRNSDDGNNGVVFSVLGEMLMRFFLMRQGFVTGLWKLSRFIVDVVLHV